MGSKKTAAETADVNPKAKADLTVTVVTLEDKILTQVRNDVINLLTSNWPQIYVAYRKAHIESGEEEFSFNIGLGVKLQPEARDVKVTAKMSYSIKYADETEPVTVSNQPDMFEA